MRVSGQRDAPAALYARGKDPGILCTGGWVGPRAGLDTEATGKILSPLEFMAFPEINLSLVLSRILGLHTCHITQHALRARA
jgi:hypothetical protein